MRYALIDSDAMRQKIAVTPQEAQRYFEENREQYATPEEVQASHILLKTDGKDDAAVKKQAEDVLAKLKAAPTSPSSRRGSRRTGQRRQGRRPRLLRSGRDGEGVRATRRSRWSPDR